MSRCEVLIVGAGPTGLALALWLSRLGVRLRIIDRAAAPGTTSRALAVQARTLELYRQVGLADAVLELGHRVPAINLWVKGERTARMPFENVGEGLTPYPFIEIFPQDEHEKLLIARLAQFGVTVERDTELKNFTQEGGRVRARITGPAGKEEICEARYLAGCDGARSLVRETLHTGFPGGTYRQIFYVADIEAAGPPVDGDLHIDLDEADFLAVFPLKGEGRARLIGTVRDERAEHPEDLRFEDVSARAIDHLKLKVLKVNWFSTYRVHHRVTGHFRGGCAFLLGDAAHIHSPAGGQGMNTGIGDAVNLAWKLAAVLAGAAPDSLLDSYESERMRFARRLVKTTDRVFTFASGTGPLADLLRTRVAPIVMPRALSLEPVREFLFRTVSQITVDYRGCPLSEGTAGQVRGGDRLPWAVTGGLDNYEPLREPRWQVHVYGTARGSIATWCAENDIALHVFPYAPEHRDAGLSENALYLLRPDSYVALVDPAAAPETLARYFTSRQLLPRGEAARRP
jgi:2-polyprenyl-6-methoxyphenol hydroxylase-like FAD-dependent oxidoreductase